MPERQSRHPSKAKSRRKPARVRRGTISQSGEQQKPSRRASQAREEVLAREPRSTASHTALSRQARSAAKGRSREERHRSSVRAVQTKGEEGLRKAAKKGARARTRQGEA
jgi:hypothetical protein